MLDVNVGVAGLNEGELLPAVVTALQGITPLPLQIDTSDPAAMEAALRLYNGKPLLNSVNGRKESMDAVFPLAKKYGGAVVALTLDENGIPPTAEGRLEIAKRILAEAQSCGISRKNLLFDPLALTVSADPAAPAVTLEAVKRITEELGCHTVLGVSNVSFGLPQRDAVNAVFLTSALTCGLSAAILNPSSAELRKTVAVYRALTGQDKGCAAYIGLAQVIAAQPAAPASPVSAASPASAESAASPLQRAIRRGLKEEAARETQSALASRTALSVIDGEIIPALDAVGREYAAGTVFLPGLLASAEAAGAAFGILRAHSQASPDPAPAKRGKVVLATVEGDVHDIGKNIVRLLLENYGFTVLDLGKDVPPARVAEAAREDGVFLVGLSALMTTTVPAMRRTIALLRQTVPAVPVVVGGAVLTPDLASEIGADHYAKDAMDTVRLAQALSASIYEEAEKKET